MPETIVQRWGVIRSLLVRLLPWFIGGSLYAVAVGEIVEIYNLPVINWGAERRWPMA